MRIHVERKPNKFYPDPKRTILRFFENNDKRSRSIIERVIELPSEEVSKYLDLMLTKFAIRHRNITKTFMQHFEKVKHLLSDINLKTSRMSRIQKLLIGAYFTMEYSMESAAFFNPSIVKAPIQYGLVEGKTKVILSFRAIGEGHLSSIVFRMGTVDEQGTFQFLPVGDRIEEAAQVKHHRYSKQNFIQKLKDMKVSTDISSLVLKDLGAHFFYSDLKETIDRVFKENRLSAEKCYELEEVMWLADSHYEIHFSWDTDISERVIFPVSEYESNGVEDARFVKFEDSGKEIYYATYTAYDGHIILPKLLETKDFYNFKVKPLYGKGAHNKNLALFPRKIGGQYAMMSRIDGINNYISFSDNLNIWDKVDLIQQPKYPWEFVQVGNCGSPMETEKGWLVITHGVGPMRTYCLGAALLDLNDPTIELGRLSEPLLVPRDDEMQGYVPNVVYSCGSLICNDRLIIPYGMSDHGSGIVTVPLDTLLDKILKP